MNLCKTSYPRGHFLPQGDNVNNLGKGFVDKTMYQMPKA